MDSDADIILLDSTEEGNTKKKNTNVLKVYQKISS